MQKQNTGYKPQKRCYSNTFLQIAKCMLLFVWLIGQSSWAITVEQQKKVISGVVTDAATGNTLPGVSIFEKGSSNGTVTDMDGNYKLMLKNANAVLVFKYIGYQTEELNPKSSKLNVQMKEDAVVLNEVVAIGYGTMKRKDLTGSTATLNADRITKMPAGDLSNSLIGIPGIAVSNGQIRIRGNRSVKASNEPLIILDGVPYKGSLESIDQNDIASIDVLKDASSTSLYGSQGANGVIIITSKQAKKNETKITYDGWAGIGIYVPENFRMSNAEEFIAFKREAYRAAGTWNGPEDDPKLFTPKEIEGFGKVDYDWYGDFMKKHGFWTNNTLAIFHGNEKTQYKISLNYMLTDVRGDHTGSTNKYKLTFDLNHSLSKKIKLGLYTRLNYNEGYTKPDMPSQLMKMLPTVTPYDENGNLVDFPTSDFGGQKNPYLNMNDAAYDAQWQNWEGLIRGYANWDIMDGLSLRLNASIDQHFNDSGSYQDDNAASYRQSVNSVSYGQGRNVNMMFNAVLNYKKTFNDHSIDAFGVFESQNIKLFNSSMSGLNQSMPYYKWFNMGQLTESKNLSTGYSRTAMLSLVGRAQYGYKDRYLASVSMRYDGASQLAKGNKWDIFPSFSLAWRISEENFMKDLNFINSLKLRGSYGVTGNHSIGAYATLGSIFSQYATFIGQNGEINYPGFEAASAPAPHLDWEKTKQFNLGIDFTILNQRISGAFDYYDSKTYDLLNQRKLPFTSGFEVMWDNIGKTRNRGYELSLFTVPVRTKDLEWNLDYNFYRNKEELVELYNPELKQDVQNGWWIGYPVNGVIYDYEFAGIWQTEEAELAAAYGQLPGDVKVVDQDNNQIIDEKDRKILGTNRPDFYMSLNSTIKWKQFDFAFDLYSEFGALAYDDKSTGQWGGDNIGAINVPVVNYWTPENPSNTNPRPVSGKTIKYLSAIGYHSNNHIVCRYLTLGYTFNKKQLFNKLNKLRLYCTVNDPFRYWKFKNEGGLGSREMTVNFGVNVDF